MTQYLNDLRVILSCALIASFSTVFQNCGEREGADLILTNGRVYTLSWDDPATDGIPAPNAPYAADGWQPDAEAIAIRDGRIIFVGSHEEVSQLYQERKTRSIDVEGATIIPGLVDSHTHVVGLGRALTELNLVGVETEEEAVVRAVKWAKKVPKGEWIVGGGWDEGAWANRYPDMKLLSARIPDHPVCLRGLHGFAIWGNRKAFEIAGITAETEAPIGGEIRKDANGNPTGILINNATDLLESAVPSPTHDQRIEHLLAGLNAMAEDGYVAVHEAGVTSEFMEALETLEAERKLPIRFYAMLNARDEQLLRRWLERGPKTDPESMLVVRSVKAHYDGALGSRGARLLDDYSDTPGHRGVSGGDYGFNQEIVAEMMKAGFQVGIHAIGDAGNRETLDFIELVLKEFPAAIDGRHRIEHAQVIHPDDLDRFAKLNVIASMEPPHAVEDKPWAEARIGAERIKGAYAWRSLRQSGARLTFNSDLSGSDHNIFYGLHAAITRRDKNEQPPEGWYPEQNMTPEEAIRAYTSWSAFSAFLENETGVIVPGRWADITVMDIDPFVLGETDPGKILEGKIIMTIVNGEIIYRRES